jgi:CheY-like chemotaxis protein
MCNTGESIELQTIKRRPCMSKILIVEDNPESRYLLERLGYTVDSLARKVREVIDIEE